jgi:hypothetical protein
LRIKQQETHVTLHEHDDDDDDDDDVYCVMYGCRLKERDSICNKDTNNSLGHLFRPLTNPTHLN